MAFLRGEAFGSFGASDQAVIVELPRGPIVYVGEYRNDTLPTLSKRARWFPPRPQSAVTAMASPFGHRGFFYSWTR